MAKRQPAWLSVGQIEIGAVARMLALMFELPTPEQRLGVSTWTASVPQGAARFLNMFRTKYFEYNRHVAILDSIFRSRNVRRVGDLGCGTAAHLIRLAKLGYECIGVDESSESLKIAAEAAESSGVSVQLVQADIRYVKLDPLLDAVIGMYVPLSPKDQAITLRNARRVLSDNGIVVQLYARILPDSPKEDELFALDTSKDDRYEVARLEHWWLKDEHIAWNAFYFAGEKDQDEGEIVHAFADHNDMQFPRRYKEEREEFLAAVGYKLLETIPLPGSKSAPPWTEELLEVLEAIK